MFPPWCSLWQVLLQAQWDAGLACCFGKLRGRGAIFAPSLGNLCLPEAVVMKVMVVAVMEGESRGEKREGGCISRLTWQPGEPSPGLN